MKKMNKLSKVGIDRSLYYASLNIIKELEDRDVVFLENGFVPIIDETGMKR